MNELEILKRRLFHKGLKKDDLFLRLCEIIQFCGGYENFMETPLAVINEINNYLNKMAEESQKAYNKSKIKRW